MKWIHCKDVDKNGEWHKKERRMMIVIMNGTSWLHVSYLDFFNDSVAVKLWSHWTINSLLCGQLNPYGKSSGLITRKCKYMFWCWNNDDVGIYKNISYIS